DDGDARGGDALTDAAGERRTALAVEVALEPVPDRLVQQHAGPARPEHDGHAAGGRRPSRKVGDRLVHGLAGVILDDLVAEIAVVETTAAARGTLLAAPVLLGDHLQRDA